MKTPIRGAMGLCACVTLRAKNFNATTGRSSQVLGRIDVVQHLELQSMDRSSPSSIHVTRTGSSVKSDDAFKRCGDSRRHDRLPHGDAHHRAQRLGQPADPDADCIGFTACVRQPALDERAVDVTSRSMPITA
jgi:hypothetical protein